ncbi:MAG: hypothetical protein K2K45_03005 [Muribaculaceae bacterium]|nr:hypothetical protein [Muribaculaceae bacterium]
MRKERIAGLAPVRKIGGAVLSLFMLVGMASCGEKSDPNNARLEIKPELGELSEYLTIESKDAVISLSEFTDDGEPYVKIMSTLQVKVNKDVASNWDFDLDAVILDKNMNKITSFGHYDIDGNSDYDNDYHYYLKAGDYRAEMETSGPKSDWDGEASAIWEKIIKDGAYVALKPRWDSAKYAPYKAGSGNSESVDENVVAEEVEVDTVADSGEDWDQILDDYESYCNKLVAAAKKAKAGDVSVMTEYASLLESAESLQKKLENASSSLSVAQATRMNKIAAKMAQAMM